MNPYDYVPTDARCTVTVRGDGTACGEPAVHSFTGSSGTTYHECELHTLRRDVELPAEHAAPEHPATRSTAPFLLVRGDRIVGYAHTAASAGKRAGRVGARVVRNSNV